MTDLPAHVERMLVEYNENGDRLRKLDTFLESGTFELMDRKDQSLMWQQSVAMSMYLNVLRDRLGRSGVIVAAI